MPCPYIGRATDQADDAVHVVGHDDKRVRLGICEMIRDRLPTQAHDVTPRVQPHGAVRHLAEHAAPVECTDGDE